MINYVVIYEKSKNGYSAYVPDLPGCTTAGKDKNEVKKNIINAIKLYVEELEDEGLNIPQSVSESETLVLV